MIKKLLVTILCVISINSTLATPSHQSFIAFTLSEAKCDTTVRQMRSLKYFAEDMLRRSLRDPVDFRGPDIYKFNTLINKIAATDPKRCGKNPTEIVTFMDDLVSFNAIIVKIVEIMQVGYSRHLQRFQEIEWDLIYA